MIEGRRNSPKLSYSPTRQLPELTIPRLGKSELTTRRVDDSQTRGVGEYDNFGLFLLPSIIALSLDKAINLLLKKFIPVISMKR
jgi:hypothetical protein